MSFKLTDFITVSNTGITTFGSDGILINRTSADAYLFFQKSGTNRGAIYGGDASDGNGLRFFIGNNSDPSLSIVSNGQVGIGGTPSYTLHVSGNIIAVEDSTPALRLIGSTTSFDLKSDGGVFKVRDVSGGNELYHIAAGASGYHNWYINDSLKMILDSSGNVGIGVTPSAWRDSAAVNSVIQGADNYAIFNRNDGGTKINFFAQNFYYNASDVGARMDSGKWSLFYSQSQEDGSHGFYTSSDASGSAPSMQSKLTISSGGVIIVGSQPVPSWISNRDIIQLGDRGSINAINSSGNIYLSNNVYVLANGNNASVKAGGASQIRLSDNEILFYTSNVASAANEVITLTPKLTISSTGNASFSERIQVKGDASLVNGDGSSLELAFSNNAGYIGSYNRDTGGGYLPLNYFASQHSFDISGTTKLTISSTGAIAVGSSSTNYGSSGQVLTSNGNASPSWTSTSGAKGEPGTTGAQGTAGSNGSNGAQGTAGTNGSNGAVGSQGTNGSTGAQGAVGLNGGTGAQGATGATGGSGGTGAQGSTGSNGGTGAQGTAGSNGSNGNNGAQGTTGAQGSTGSTGSNGSNGGTGAQGTSGVATFPYSGTATFSNQIRLSNSGGYLYGGTITTRLGSRAIDMGYNGSCYFQANRTDSSSAQFLCGSATSMTGIWSRVGTTNGGVSYDSGPRVFKITMGTTVRMQMDTNGVITGDFNDISDILFKKNIEFHGYGLVAVNSLKPREFNWKQINRPQEKQIGFIAQEVEEIIPEVIHGFDGNKSINGTGLISILTKAIQELSQEVTTLKAEVELLKQQ